MALSMIRYTLPKNLNRNADSKVKTGMILAYIINVRS